MGQYTGAGTFTKITSEAELTDGYYVVTNETDEFLMTRFREGGNYFDSAPSGESGGEISNPSVDNVWKIETNGSGRTIYNEVISRYIGHSGSSNTASSVTSVSNNSRWTFTYTSGKWTVNNVATSTRQLSYNATDPRFAAYNNNGQHELQLFKLEIPTTPCSGTPDAGTASVSPTSNSPGTDYTVSATGYSTGATGLSYQWEYNINNSGWSHTSPVSINATTSYSDYEATNDAFAPPIGQSVQWRLVTSCSPSGQSNTSSTATFTSILAYCIPSFSYSSDYIANFELEDIDNNGSGFSSGGYGDHTDLSTDLVENTIYNASLTSSAGSGNHGVAIWIDFNDNGTFETSERVGTLNNVSASQTVSIPITIPSGNIGSHRMRVIYEYGVQGNAIDPCVSEDWGEAEDYMVNIIEACTPPADPNGNIDGETTACSSTTLTYDGTDADIAYWQTSPTGTSTDHPATSPYVVPATPGTFTYYIRVYDEDCWSLNTVEHTIDVFSAPIIASHPINQTAIVTHTATFTFSATGATSYQWYVSTNGGANWSSIAGATSATYITDPTTLAMNDYRYRAAAFNECDEVTSNHAVLTVQDGPCGTENFDNAGLTASYADGSFVGNGGITWTYVQSRDENGDANNSGIDGNAIMLRRASDESKITSSTISGGISDFSVKLYKGFTGNGNRQVELFINGISQGTSTPFNDFNEHIFEISGINIEGDIYIEIRNITGNQVILDDILWTCYSNPCTAPPIALSPQSGPEGTVVTVTGSDFTETAEVSFHGLPAVVTFINETTLEAVVPAGATTGQIIVSADGEDCHSEALFTVIDQNLFGCEGMLDIPGVSEGQGGLVFYEIFDREDGSFGVIVVLNASYTAIDLNDYQIGRSADWGGTMVDNWHVFNSMILEPGEVYILGTGNLDDCQNIPELNGAEAGGFNDNDRLQIIKKAGLIVVDEVRTPSPKGYYMIRNSGATPLLPNPTHQQGDWSSNSTSSGHCQPDLGISPISTGSPSYPTINTYAISNPDCDEMQITVAAVNGHLNGDLNYKWFVNTPGGMGWTQINNGGIYGGATTAALTVNNITGINLNQYYVRVGESDPNSCWVASPATRYTYDSDLYYRTKNSVSANWTDACNWEISSNESGPWRHATTYPFNQNSGKITIRDGHTVNLDVGLSVNWLEIEAGGTLNLESSPRLTIHDGNPSGADLVVNGTLIDNGHTLGGVDYGEQGDPTWEMGSGATVIKTNTSSAARYRDNYEGGIANIPADGNWLYRRTEENNLSLVAANMYYPNLSFENHVSGNYSPTDPFHMLTGTSPMLVKGNLNVGMAGSGTYTLRTINSHANPILIEGSLNIGSGSSILNTDETTFGTGFEVQGDMDIEGTLNLSAGTGAGEGVLKLSGSDDMIGVGSGTVLANHLVIDKEPGAHLQSELNFEVQESAQFLNGILELENETNVFTFQAGAITSGASNTSFVNGRVRKSANTGEDFTFPIGDTKGDTIAWYQPARIFENEGATTIDAQYFAEAHPEAGPYHNGSTQNNQHIGTCDFWRVEKVSGVDVRLGFTYINPDDTTYCNDVGSANHLTMHRWNGLAWDPPGNGVDPTSGEGIGEIRVGLSGVATEYGDFALSSTNGDLNILPIELLRFEAVEDGAIVQTAWATSSESNNAFFTVERSADARTFQPIGKVDGAGNSHTTLHYAFTDQKPLYGISYYRLKQTDFDGLFTFSDIRAVSFSESTGFSLDLTYRNENDLNLVYTAISPYILVEIFDVLGKRVFTEVAENYNGRSVLTPTLGRGAYVVRITSGAQTDSGKIVW